jgi:hypothetical protein
MKKIPLSKEQHIALSDDLDKAQEILEPWMDVFCAAYAFKSRECKTLLRILKLITSDMRIQQFNHWHEIDENNGKSPYCGDGKSFW